jgi:hypothetical protein
MVHKTIRAQLIAHELMRLILKNDPAAASAQNNFDWKADYVFEIK